MALVIKRLKSVPSADGAVVPEAPLVDPDTPSLAGTLGPGLGARLLMHLFAEHRTGRLVLEGGPAAPRGTVYVLHGEPAHLRMEDGGAALERRLHARGRLGSAQHATRPRHFIAALLRRSDPIAILESLRDEVRDFGTQVILGTSGRWSFFDDPQALDSAPLTAVNPFGLALDVRRRTTPPQDLFRLADDLANLFIVPGDDFDSVAARLLPFTSNVDLATLCTAPRRVRDVIAQASLNPTMGALVLQTLADTGRIRLQPTAPPALARRAPAQAAPAARPELGADVPQLSALAAAPQRGGLDILALYLELKPEPDDDAVLGIEGSSGIAAIERAYQQRLAEIDARAIPAGPHRTYLLARVEELRARIDKAYHARMGSRPRTKTTSAYQVLDRIGVGGMAEVFRGVPADDPTHFVAIKVVLPQLREDTRFAQMFLEEARLARRIQHPNVVRVLAVGRGNNDLYLTMEYIDGLDFAELLRRGRAQGTPISIDVVCRVIADACAGLHAAHTAHDRNGLVTPILHRDVSPQNILVSRTGEVKLSDFGIAKALDTQEDDDGTVKGKIPYLAPELIRGTPASVQSDIYAMAMSVYAAVAHLPFQRPDRIEAMRAILHEPLPRLSSIAPGVPPILDALLLTAAAPRPEDRHTSALQLQLEFEEILARRPPVDVAGWARPLAGQREEPGPPTRPITDVRSSTGLTGTAETDPDGKAAGAWGGNTAATGNAEDESVDVDMDGF